MSQAQTLTPVALYARDSSVNQEERADRSIQAQLDAMRDYAEGNHMRPVSHWSRSAPGAGYAPSHSRHRLQCALQPLGEGVEVLRALLTDGGYIS